MVYYRVHKSQLMDPAHNVTPYFLNARFNIILPSTHLLPGFNNGMFCVQNACSMLEQVKCTCYAGHCNPHPPPSAPCAVGG
jgi:hypothetical protein